MSCPRRVCGTAYSDC